MSKNLNDVPLSLRISRKRFKAAVAKLGKQKKWPKKYSNIYKSPSVKEGLHAIYHGKCGYCNQKPLGSPLQVEHFRPKDGISGLVHTGYYWLGYEWSNLLFSCGNCNRPKSNNFPLMPGITRIGSPVWLSKNKFCLNSCSININPLKAEKYVLLNPEWDIFEKHLYYAPDGEIISRDDRGKESIKFYDLNRQELYIDGRKKLIEELIMKMAGKLKRLDSGERNESTVRGDILDIVIWDLIKPIESNGSFDHFRFTIFSNYDVYIIPRFTSIPHQNLIKEVFSNLIPGYGLKLK